MSQRCTVTALVGRRSLAVLAIGALVQSFLLLSAPSALAYSCGSGTGSGGANGGHCYGIVDWAPAGNLTPNRGGLTAIQVVHLGCNGFYCQNNSGHINNEMWVQDTYQDWVEAGYSTYTPVATTSEIYFWADKTPSSTYTFHLIQTVPSGDYGAHADVYIYWVSTDTYRIEIASPNVAWDTTAFTTYSPTHVVIGQELAGSAGASAPIAHFIDNYWYDTSNHSHAENTAGTVEQDSPPYGSWSIYPYNSSSGGDFATHCC